MMYAHEMWWIERKEELRGDKVQRYGIMGFFATS